MQTLSQKIIVKVGKTSNIKFRNVKAIRAITITELNKLHELNPDASIAVIENIKAADYESLKEFINKFESANSNNRVFFYLPDNDDTTSGVADELDKDIYLNLVDLQDAIENIYKIPVSTDMNKIKSSAKEIDLDDDPFDSSFDGALTAEDSSNTQDNEVQTEVISETTNIKINEQTNNKSEKDGVESKSNDDTLLDKNKLSKPNSDNIPSTISSTEIELLRKQLKDAQSKTDNLSNLVKALESEKAIISDKLEKYLKSEVMEQPIPLTQYKQLEDRVKELTAQNGDKAELAAKLNDALEKVKTADEYKESSSKSLEDYKRRLQESGAKLIEARKLTEAHEVTIKELEEKIKESEKTERLSKETEAKLIALTESKAESEKKISQLNEDISKLNDKNTELIAKMQSEVDA